MTRKCFFHIRDGDHYYTDGEGRECEDLDHMACEAAVTACSIARDNAAKRRHGSVCVEVANQSGELVAVATAMVDLNLIRPQGFSSEPLTEA
jgi:hypothetical protein